jgi:putative aldouronate transport system substrate-binding protein
VFGLMNDYDKDFLSHYGFQKFGDFVNPPIELAPYGEAWQINKDPINKDYQDFLNIQDTQLPQVIMASEGEFDAKWDAFVEAINPSCEVYSEFMHEEILKLVAAYYGKAE